jgi:DNA-binding response OmpR family regulator
MDSRAVVVVNDTAQARPILESLSRKGFSGIVESDPQKALEACKIRPPDLVIVEDRLTGTTGSRFLSELVKVSWSTSTILVTDEEEEIVHQRTEGLGILGHMRNCGDTARLERLLDKLLEMRRLNE